MWPRTDFAPDLGGMGRTSPKVSQNFAAQLILLEKRYQGGGHRNPSTKQGHRDDGQAISC